MIQQLVYLASLSGPNCSFYSPLLLDSTELLFIQWAKRNQLQVGYQVILSQLMEMGVRQGGAAKRRFRSEGIAHALPSPVYVSLEGRIDLRLYAYRFSSSCVFLFDGGIKTAQTAQECPNVAKHFALANTLSAYLDSLFQKGELTFSTFNHLKSYGPGITVRN